MDTKNYTLSLQDLTQYGCSEGSFYYRVRDRETGKIAGSVRKADNGSWEACRTWRDEDNFFPTRHAAATWLVADKRVAALAEVA